MFAANHRGGRLRQCWEASRGCLGLKYGRSRLCSAAKRRERREGERERDRERGGNREYRETTSNPGRRLISTHARVRPLCAVLQCAVFLVCATCSLAQSMNQLFIIHRFSPSIHPSMTVRSGLVESDSRRRQDTTLLPLPFQAADQTLHADNNNRTPNSSHSTCDMQPW
ncbi:hypothetical protein CCMA1212_002066 [Trichoderma ghanense]|uniref:Uncharacterized protein n=1 Tax=Trichoderma ghanense TaxID=65468 RepID=A0ABY2HEE3_9HYPO